MNMKTVTPLVSIIAIISMILTTIPIIQVSNAINNPITNTIDCNSKKGTANTLAGALNYGGVKCEGQNGGTASAGGIKSNSGTIGMHGIQGPKDNSHIGGIIKR